ncbi:MAG: lipid-A-disaccharide synthase N-terminal domain-containing protein [Candidatus Omnitrophota bacterium]
MNGWTIFGLLGQICFATRFLLQWIASEKKKKSTFPVAFWYLSIAGSIVLFIYAMYIKDAVFMLGQSVGSIIYIRNLVLIARHEKVLA